MAAAVRRRVLRVGAIGPQAALEPSATPLVIEDLIVALRKELDELGVVPGRRRSSGIWVAITR